MTPRSRFSSAALAVALCAAATPASGQTPTAKPVPSADARNLLVSGESKYTAGDCPGALADFEAAEAIKDVPEAPRFIGLCEDKLGHYALAVIAYERFLSNVPTKLMTEADGVRARVAELKAMPGHVHVDTSPPGAAISIDGKEQASPSPLDADLPAGPRLVHATLHGYDPAEKNVTVKFASKQNVVLQLAEAAPLLVEVPAPPPPPPPPAPPPPPPPPSPEHYGKIPAVVLGGLALVAVGVGTGYGIAAVDNKSELGKDHPRPPSTKGKSTLSWPTCPSASRSLSPSRAPCSGSRAMRRLRTTRMQRPPGPTASR